MTDAKQTQEDLTPPEEFNKIINDFTNDILVTFPEYSGLISKWWNRPTSSSELTASKQKETLFVFRHCIKAFPERFFDILYKNVDIFAEDTTINTEFLPGIVFKQLWSCDISDITRETIWKYLQLILFSVIGSVHNSSEFGDTAKLFEAINEEELKNKLQETLEGMQNLFDTNEDLNGATNANNVDPSFNMPNAQDIHEHINSMMGGKLGKLAMELAEETAATLNLDMDNVGSSKDIFQKLFKNPAKMMSMVKNIGSKIDDKIKSGEIKESELMQEGMELLEKMKDMPGMADMMKQMGLGKGSKINMGALETNLRNAKLKERLRAKADANANAKLNATSLPTMNNNNNNAVSEEELIKIFSTGEKVEKTPRGAKPPPCKNENKKKKNKNKN